MKSAIQPTQFFSETKACLKLSIPLALAQFTQSATAFVDTIMMGWLGSQTIAAGGLGAVTFHGFLIAGSGILSAVSSLVAEAYGAKNPQKIGQVTRQGLWLALLLSIPISITLWHGDVLLQLLRQDPENIKLAHSYLKVIAWGFFPALGFTVLKNLVSSLSQTRPIMLVIIGGTLMNICGNYILMFGKFGLPALGLAGIGLASTLSLWGIFIALGIYTLSQAEFKRYHLLHKLYQLDLRVFRELLQLGIPVGILALVESGLFTATAFLMGQLGTVTLAAHQIALQTAAITFTIPMGISFATTVRVGQVKGQQDVAGASLAGYVGMMLGAVFMALMGILFLLMPEPIISLYLDIHQPENQAVVNLAKTLLKVAALFQIVDGIQVTAVGALRGIKDTYIPMMIGIFAYWGVGFSSGYGLSMKLDWGGVGLWIGLALGLAMAAIILPWRFYLQTHTQPQLTSS